MFRRNTARQRGGLGCEGRHTGIAWPTDAERTYDSVRGRLRVSRRWFALHLTQRLQQGCTLGGRGGLAVGRPGYEFRRLRLARAVGDRVRFGHPRLPDVRALHVEAPRQGPREVCSLEACAVSPCLPEVCLSHVGIGQVGFVEIRSAKIRRCERNPWSTCPL